MSKQNRIVDSAVEKAVQIEKVVNADLKVVEFTNTRGMSMSLMGLPPYLVQMATESIPRPKAPTYKVERADGGTDEFSHSEDTIKDPKTTEEEKIQWETFLSDVKSANSKASEVLLNVIIMEGIKLDVVPEDMAKWEKRMKVLGIPLPDDEMEKEMFYKKEYAFATQEDVEIIMSKVLELTGISREEVELAKSSFPDKVEPKA
jgi:hypothetical protein